MWSNWRFLRQAASYQRLAIALCLSLLLHLFLIGKFDFNLPDLSNERHVIEAQLVAVKPMPAKVETKPIVKKAGSPKPVQKAAAVQSAVPAATDSAPSEPSLPSGERGLEANSSTTPPEPIESLVEAQPEEPDLAINPNAYKYVETEFDVRTDIGAKIDSSPAGKARMVYQLLPDGERYHLKSLMQAKGLIALFIPDLLQTSDGYLTNTGLQPQHYLYQFGDKRNKTFSADFDWESKKLTLHSANEVKDTALVEGTQDLLSFMYQFMFVPPLQTMQLNITNGKKLGIYDYGFEGEETIATKMGNLTTIHLLRVSADSDEKTELWLALDYQYVPVKIRKTEKEGKVYELLVTSLKTEKPANPPQ